MEEKTKNKVVMTHRNVKRKRGGQQGNLNACKHGFYSGHLHPAEIEEFWEICRHHVAPEIAILLVKLRSILQQAPDNRRVLDDASGLLAEWYAAKYRLDGNEKRQLKRLIFNILEHHQPGIPLESIMPVLTKRIERTLTN